MRKKVGPRSLLGAPSERRVVPRWRPSSASPGLELSTHGKTRKFAKWSEQSFARTLRRWRQAESVATALAVARAAAFSGREDLARDAYGFLRDRLSKDDPRLRGLIILPTPVAKGSSDSSAGQSRFLSLKKRLAQNPRLALSWCDLSLAYCSVGNVEKARHAMGIAQSLAPTNKFITRSAARFHIHLDEPDRAHRLLLGHPDVRNDPWLLSAEIATAAVAEKTSKYLKLAQKSIIEDRWSPEVSTELAAAVGTEELCSGSNKAARIAINKSLLAPTDNSLAQATFVARSTTGIELEKATPVHNAFEAGVYKFWGEGDLRQALDGCQLWLGDEPFSSGPAVLGSYLAMVGLGDTNEAEALASRGLAANPRDVVLLNNKVVALAEQGREADAIQLFNTIDFEGAESRHKPLLVATAGLLYCRYDAFDRGARLYESAISYFRERGDYGSALLAELYFIREMKTRGLPEATARLDRLKARLDAERRWEVREFANRVTKQGTLKGQISHLAGGLLNTLRRSLDKVGER